MQYTLRNIPDEIDQAIRERALANKQSLNRVLIEAIARGLGLSRGVSKQRDLSDIAGSWVEDPETEAALEEQGRIDPELWR